MSEEKNISTEKAHERFEEACVKFETWTRLYESPISGENAFDISDEPEEELRELKEQCNTPELIAQFNEECEGLTTFEKEVKIFETQILFNKITDNADQIYADILKYAKIIARHLNKIGLDKEEFEVRVYNMGTFKTDIDDDKEICEEISDEVIFPETERIESIFDEELTKYLFG